MYNKKWKAWEAEPCEEALLIWCREPFNRDNPEALYRLADTSLAKTSNGKETADAVYQMEKAANLGLAQAALAMGQMFQYGWAVHRSEKTAKAWYEKASALGSDMADACLKELGRKKKRRMLSGAIMAVAVILLATAGAFCLTHIEPQGILVHEDTKLTCTATLDEFQQALNNLIDRYDDELVVSGLSSTNRLMLAFEGDGIDLRDFPAAEIISDEDNYVVIQFETEEEAQRCLAAMKQLDGLLFVDMDEYQFMSQNGTVNQTTHGVPYTSPYTGMVYYSWGVEYLGMDRLADWIMDQPTTPVTVAVLDTGVEPCDETQNRILKGKDLFDPNGDGWKDSVGHGTHVAGTIIDCTRGLDVSIFPVRIFDGASTSYTNIVMGLKIAISNNVDVINMSLGGPCNSGKDYYIKEAINQGIVVVVSAGNQADNTCNYCPAHIADCIVVSACDNQSLVANFSNYGDSVDACAPGVDVVSYYPGGILQSLDGTSMAAPHVSALAAMIKLYLPGKSPKQIEKYICDYCIDMGDSLYYGEGIPWAEYFVGE